MTAPLHASVGPHEAEGREVDGPDAATPTTTPAPAPCDDVLAPWMDRRVGVRLPFLWSVPGGMEGP